MTRIHMARSPVTLDGRSYGQAANSLLTPSQLDFDLKPRGFWYAFDDSWVSWAKENMNWLMGDYLYEVKVHSTNILSLSTYDELVQLTKEYKCSFSCDRIGLFMDWRRFSEKYDGIEINPYIWKARLEFMWYYGWDVASGCIWNLDKVELVPLDDKTKGLIVGEQR
jgi:hypothetical protein